MSEFENLMLNENIQLDKEEEIACKNLIEDGIRRGLSLDMISQDFGIPPQLVDKIYERSDLLKALHELG